MKLISFVTFLSFRHDVSSTSGVGLIKAVPQSQVLYLQVKESLDTHLSSLLEEWAALPRTALSHGDPNVGNFIRTHTGKCFTVTELLVKVCLCEIFFVHGQVSCAC